MKQVCDFVRLSKYAGERFDLVQAGGGNTSVKISETEMLIKASGLHLSEIEDNYGYCKVNFPKLIEFLNQEDYLLALNKQELEEASAKCVSDSSSNSSQRPSIEIFLHSILGKFVLHTHSLAVNSVVCRANGIDLLKKDWKEKAVFVEYYTPGSELAIHLNRKIKEFKKQFKRSPQIVFLQNHGLIVSTDSVDELISLNEQVTVSIEKSMGFDFSEYRLTNQLSHLINAGSNSSSISYMSTDSVINGFLLNRKELFFHLPISPDQMVYCGPSPLEIRSIEDSESVQNYRMEFGVFPKVIIFENKLFFIAQTLKKAKEIEEVLKFHLIILSVIPKPVYSLPMEELNYLVNWEAEKYRQNGNNHRVSEIIEKL
jgi:ribulose-5-phosphate 4-epimerase/fuculose-1-phosphate aldolase